MTGSSEGIQYTAASRFNRHCSGILDHPLSRMMTAKNLPRYVRNEVLVFTCQTAGNVRTQLRDLTAHSREFCWKLPAL
jgi:hypothetical protein